MRDLTVNPEIIRETSIPEEIQQDVEDENIRKEETEQKHIEEQLSLDID